MNINIDKKALFRNKRLIYLFMIFVAVILSIKYVFIDFGIDAEFQITMSYRLATGDIMFKEMWEPYQMSAFLCAFFIKIYLALFKTTTGIVLYLQIIGVLLDALVSYLLYKTVDKYLNSKNVTFFMAWVFFLVSPKDVPLPEYANMQIWFSLLLCITIFLYLSKNKVSFVILSALSLCGIILSYPSCLIISFGAIALLLYYGHKKHTLVFCSTCLTAGILYLCFIFQKISIKEFGTTIGNILAIETSHSMGIVDKFIIYLKEFAEIAMALFILYLISFIVINIISKIRNVAESKDTCGILTDMLFLVLVLLISLYTVILWKENVRYCYSFSFLGIILIGMHHVKKLSGDKFLFYLCCTVISIMEFISTLVLTNLALIASVPYLLIALIAAFLPISEALKTLEMKKIPRIWTMVPLLFGVIFLIFRNIYIIRPMNGDVSSLLDIRGIVKSGPAIGIISEYMGPYIHNESIKEWEQYIEEGDSIYLIGGTLDTLGYLYTNGTDISAPSLVPTPGYNEHILEYWELNPDKYPDVIIASCWYGTMNPELTEDSWIMNWIEDEYNPQYYLDGKYWRYYFK